MTMPIERSTGDPTAKDSTMEVDDDDKTVQSKGSGAKIEEKLTEFLIKLTIWPTATHTTNSNRSSKDSSRHLWSHSERAR
jgi:hypothetical protein